MPVAVLAGGLGTRLGAAVERIPKILLDVDGRPFAEALVELLERKGVRHVVLSLGHLGEQVQQALGDGSRWSMAIQYVFDGPSLLGTGGALLRALPALGPAFFVVYGDSYLDCDFAAVEAAFRSSGKPGLMTVFRNDDQWDRSNVQFEHGRIVRYDKSHRGPEMRHIDYGLGVLTPEAFEPWRGRQAPFDLAEIYQGLIARDALAACEIEQRFYEIGSPEGLAEVRTLIAERGRVTR